MKVHTIESIHARCVEVGDCWEWPGSATASKRHPVVRHQGKVVLVRRLLAALSGKPVPDDKKASMACENHRCVNPEHIVIQTHRQVMKRQGELGKLSEPSRIAKIAATKRAKYAKLTMDDARAIRSSGATHTQAAEQYGVHPSKVASIRQHRCWREFTGNPFAGLGARA